MEIREVVEKHLQAAIEGKMDVVIGDLIPELVPVVQGLAPKLGEVQPQSFEILEERTEGETMVVRFALIGKQRLVVEDTWKEIEGVWKVVKVQPIE